MFKDVSLSCNRHSRSAGSYVRSLARLVYSNSFANSRYLAVIGVYCDESYENSKTVFTIAGLLAKVEDWGQLAERWKARCQEDGISCYHATDCAGQWGDFAHLSKEQCGNLNADLITLVTQADVWGFGISIVWSDFEAVVRANAAACDFLGPDPYYLAMQILIIDICNHVRSVSLENKLAFWFDRNEETSGKSKQIYDDVRKRNSDLSPLMGPLTYDNRCDLVPLQVADEVAFETMKNALGHLNNRPDRKPIQRLKEAHRFVEHALLRREALEQIARVGKLRFEVQS